MPLRNNLMTYAEQRRLRSVKGLFGIAKRWVTKTAEENRNALNIAGGAAAFVAVASALVAGALYFSGQSDQVVRDSLDDNKNPIILLCNAGPNGTINVRTSHVDAYFPSAKDKKLTPGELAILMPQKNELFSSCVPYFPGVSLR